MIDIVSAYWDNESESNMDRATDSDFFAELQAIRDGGNGVFLPESNRCQVVPLGGFAVRLLWGWGAINGRAFAVDPENKVGVDFAIDPAVTLPYVARVVIRQDKNGRVTSADVVKGTPASTPVAPNIVRTADIWEIVPADIRVSVGATEITALNISDQRFEPELCGVVAPTWGRIDETTLYQEYQAYLVELQKGIEEAVTGILPDKSITSEKVTDDFVAPNAENTNKLDGKQVTDFLLKSEYAAVGEAGVVDQARVIKPNISSDDFANLNLNDADEPNSHAMGFAWSTTSKQTLLDRGFPVDDLPTNYGTVSFNIEIKFISGFYYGTPSRASHVIQEVIRYWSLLVGNVPQIDYYKRVDYLNENGENSWSDWEKQLTPAQAELDFAPSGFGWGERKLFTDIDKIVGTSIGDYTNNSIGTKPKGIVYGRLINFQYINSSDGAAYNFQVAFPSVSGVTSGLFTRGQDGNGVWLPWKQMGTMSLSGTTLNIEL